MKNAKGGGRKKEKSVSSRAGAQYIRQTTARDFHDSSFPARKRQMAAEEWLYSFYEAARVLAREKL